MFSRFSALVEDICRLLGQQAPSLEPDASGGTSWLSTVADACFELAYMPGAHSNRFLLEVRLGPPPNDCDELLGLLQANLELLRGHDAAFAWRRAANELVYEVLIPLRDCDPARLLESMRGLADSVREWNARRQFTISGRPGALGARSETETFKPSIQQQVRAAVVDVVNQLCDDERTLRAESGGEESSEVFVALLGFEEIDVRLIHASPSADMVLLEFGFGPVPAIDDSGALLELMEVDGYGLLDRLPIMAADADESQLYACRICAASSLTAKELLEFARQAGAQYDAWVAAAFPDLMAGAAPAVDGVMSIGTTLPFGV